MHEINPIRTVFYSMDKAIKEYRKYAQSRISKVEPNITLDQTLLLALINNGKKYSQTELSQFLFKDFASITRMIELLVKNGFLTRSVNNSDRRKTSLELTPKGETTIENLTPVIFQNRTNALEGISDIEQDSLNLTLNKIADNCTKHLK